MWKITIKGEASTDYVDLKKLDGIDCQDEFSEYFDDDFSFKDDVTNGYMFFKFEDNKLMTYTIYDSNRKLSQEELYELGEYTQGQWSDGIGEGFEQNPCYFDKNYTDEDGNKGEVYISPWQMGQELEIVQEELVETE